VTTAVRATILHHQHSKIPETHASPLSPLRPCSGMVSTSAGRRPFGCLAHVKHELFFVCNAHIYASSSRPGLWPRTNSTGPSLEGSPVQETRTGKAQAAMNATCHSGPLFVIFACHLGVSFVVFEWLKSELFRVIYSEARVSSDPRSLFLSVTWTLFQCSGV
jgi:hypothetical protein